MTTEHTTTAETTGAEADDLSDVLGQWSFVGTMGGYTLHSGGERQLSRVISFGDEFEVSVELINSSRDRHGHSRLLAELRSENEQLRRYSEVRFRKGSWPQGVMRSLPGSPVRLMIMNDERRAAMLIRDPDARAETLRRLREVYGSDWLASGKSRTIGQAFGGRHLPDE